MTAWDEPAGAEGASADAPTAEQEALRRLEARLARASEAAERLMREAAAAAAGSGSRSGAESGTGTESGTGAESGTATESESKSEGAEGEARDREASRSRDREASRPDDLELLAQVARRFRDLIPPELQHRLAEAVRELLLALRALIDWYLERVERRRGGPPEVTDIPIE